MKIGIDISQIAYAGTGVARFTRGLTETILQCGADHEWVFFFSALRNNIDPSLKKKIESTKHTSIQTVPFPPSILSMIWNDAHILEIEKLTGKLDWFITSDWTEPPARCKKATIVHDLVFKKYPETVHPTILKTQEKRLNWVAKESHAIIADSLTTEGDLTKFYDIPDEKIHTIYPGVQIDHIPSGQDRKNVEQKYNLDTPYIITVGKREPRKNIERLIGVFQKLLQEKQIDPQVKLLIVGPQGWGDSPTQQKDAVRFLGFVPDNELYALYQSAQCLVFPSLYEGFGYPAVEAMLLGCPVAMSNTSSLAEIGTNSAAALFDPLDEQNMQLVLEDVLNNKDTRRKLTKNGAKRAQDFSWKLYFDRVTTILF